MRTVVFRPPEGHKLSNLNGCKGKIINTRGRTAWIRFDGEYRQRENLLLLTDREYLRDE